MDVDEEGAVGGVLEHHLKLLLLGDLDCLEVYLFLGDGDAAVRAFPIHLQVEYFSGLILREEAF